ncbi:MAG: YpdA family putative bacillithiol disulfide reductase [Vicinamibacterales bacterium]|jgi:thioredoxin reductase (NADPH)|nr:YpdA family putative bacillithiol disulfide reductase [Vicinamibacterales bacterium]HJN47066.1 YpdA family putative bacillithiol disulfide reductase [Vicinamibacterales bacterium]
MNQERADTDRVRDVIVVGAGPAGLASAIAAGQAGLDCEVIERGALVNSILHFPTNMVFFTTPELLEIGGLPFVTPNPKPTRGEALRYYRRVTDTYNLDVQFGVEVRTIRREAEGDGTPLLRVETLHQHAGPSRRLTRTAVVAIGAYERPNMLGVPGEDLPHVSHYYGEAHAYYRKRVVIVGGKNSAAEAALELHRAGANVTLLHRHAELGSGIKYWVRPDIENRIKEGSVTAYFNTHIAEIRPTEVTIEHAGEQRVLPADAVFLLTGHHPDTAMLERFGIDVDPQTMVPAHDADTYETNLPNLFLAGQVISGIHSGLIFIENGRFHGEMVIKEIARRLARRRDTVHAAADTLG